MYAANKRSAYHLENDNKRKYYQKYCSVIMYDMP